MTETQKRIWKTVRNWYKFSRSDIMFTFNLSRGGAWHLMKAFQDEGLTVRRGEGRNSYHEVISKEKI